MRKRAEHTSSWHSLHTISRLEIGGRAHKTKAGLGTVLEYSKVCVDGDGVKVSKMEHSGGKGIPALKKKHFKPHFHP